MSPKHKALVWLRGEVKTPPFSPEARLIAEVFSKTTRATPASIIAVCKQRLKAYDQILKGGD